MMLLVMLRGSCVFAVTQTLTSESFVNQIIVEKQYGYGYPSEKLCGVGALSFQVYFVSTIRCISSGVSIN